MIYYRAIFDFPDGEYTVDRRNITALNVGQKDRGSAGEISFGIYSNSGHISFVDDADRTILKYADEGKLASGIKCKVYLINSLAKTSSLVAEMYSAKWHYDNNNFVVSVDIKDELEEWQEIAINKIPIMLDSVDEQGTVSTASKSVNTMISQYFLPQVKLRNYNIEFLSDIYLTNVYIANPYLEQCSLWSFGAKLCEVGACKIFKLRDTIYVKYYGG